MARAGFERIQQDLAVARARKPRDLAKAYVRLLPDQPELVFQLLQTESRYVRTLFILIATDTSIGELSAAIDSDATYVSRSLHNHKGLSRQWKQVAEALRVPLKWLLTGESANPEDEVRVWTRLLGTTRGIKPSTFVSPFGLHLPRTTVPIELRITAFGMAVGTVLIAEIRKPDLGDQVIVALCNNEWRHGWVLTVNETDFTIIGSNARVMMEAVGGDAELVAAANVRDVYVVVGLRTAKLMTPSVADLIRTVDESTVDEQDAFKNVEE